MVDISTSTSARCLAVAQWLIFQPVQDQELQEPKGLHQNQITSKKPPDSKGNQEAEMAAAKGLLPHEDHRRTKS